LQDKKTSLSIAGSGFTLQAAILLVFSVFKLVGIHSIAWVLPVSLAVTILATSGLLASRNGLGISALFKLNALFLALLAASLYVASIFYDQSFDGRWYHQEGVIQLNRGFDPFRQTLDENSLPGHVWSIASTRMPMSSSPLWINHYPKGSEIVAASIFALRMGMEAAKGFNFLLLASAILLTYGTFLEYWPGRHRTAALLAAAIGLNPVVVGQLWSNYNDGQLYLLLVGLACSLCTTARARVDGSSSLASSPSDSWRRSSPAWSTPSWASPATEFSSCAGEAPLLRCGPPSYWPVSSASASDWSDSIPT